MACAKAWVNLSKDGPWLKSFASCAALDLTNSDDIVGKDASHKMAKRIQDLLGIGLERQQSLQEYMIAAVEHANIMMSVEKRYAGTDRERRQMLIGAQVSRMIDRVFRETLADHGSLTELKMATVAKPFSVYGLSELSNIRESSNQARRNDMLQTGGNTNRWLVLSSMVAVLAASGIASPGSANEPDFAGKNVTMIVSSAPGGGTDITARLVGTAIAKHLPGQPSIVYRHQPAAGGIAALNTFYVQAAPDGLSFFIGAGNQLNPDVLRRPGTQYDPTKLENIGGFSNPSNFLLIRPDVYERLMNRSGPLNMAVLDGTRSGDFTAMWGAESLGWNLKLIFGYTGTSAMALAFQRGEVDMMNNNALAVIGPMIKAGQAQIVAQTGEFSQGKISPHSHYPDAPILRNMVYEGLPPNARVAFTVWERQAQIGKWFALPPKTPANYVKLYREALAKVSAEPDFIEQMNKLVSPGTKVMSAEDMTGIIQDMNNVTDATLDYFSALTKKYRN